MLKFSKFSTIVLFSAIAINQAYAEEKPIAVVNGVSIPQARANMLIKNASLQGKADTPELRSSIQDELINREIMAQEAVKNLSLIHI